ncbi:hypothetical protein ACIOWK_33950 [Pseudomonas protegens]|uniref:hypothetical protein n=1 Tax=Pseudomonas protegens TaxID=380021 RepID=UPI003821BD59
MEDDVRVTTRMPKEIASWLKTQAKEQNRSANGQLIEFLAMLMRQSKNEQA